PMSSLQEALQCLSPTPWAEVPQTQNELRAYITDISNKAKLIVDSIPESPPPDPNYVAADSALARVSNSSVRVSDSDPEIQSLQQQWGKAIKISSVKDNPFAIPVYKLAGGDGRGAWFARRSVHEGLPFSTWKGKFSSEMDETLKANQECMGRGGIPDKAVRGIGAEQEIESVSVMDEAGKSVLGTVKVYHVSARFPRPTTSRDFVVLGVSWEGDVGGLEGGRCCMTVSKPCSHPDAPAGEAYIRGEYESVEVVREIPVKRDGEEESNPVEWIMVTRSDPGGNIPRWMVEKGTPKSICSDTVKFLDWVCRDTPLIEPESEQPREAKSDQEDGDTDSDSDSDSEYDSASEEPHNGLIASFAYLLNAGLERYAPQAVLDYIPQHSHSRESSQQLGEKHTTDDQTLSDKKSLQNNGDAESHLSPDKASLMSGNSGLASIENGHTIPPSEIMQMDKKGKMTSNERHLAKLAERKRDVESKLETVRAEIESLHLERELSSSEHPNSSASSLAKPPDSSPSSSNINHSHNRNKSSSNLETAQMHKAASGLFGTESKLLKELGKIEKEQLKLTSKIESQAQKDAKREEKSRDRSKTDAMRREIEELKKEVDRLRTERRQWLELVGTLEAENTRLASKAGVGEDK
ncbi:hypothetical protein ASPWEDRAFT_104096, partial [Aspergillus wentii DTO 134E9]